MCNFSATWSQQYGCGWANTVAGKTVTNEKLAAWKLASIESRLKALSKRKPGSSSYFPGNIAYIKICIKKCHFKKAVTTLAASNRLPWNLQWEHFSARATSNTKALSLQLAKKDTLCKCGYFIDLLLIYAKAFWPITLARCLQLTWNLRYRGFSPSPGRVQKIAGRSWKKQTFYLERYNDFGDFKMPSWEHHKSRDFQVASFILRNAVASSVGYALCKF